MSKIDVFVDESGILRKFGASVYCLVVCKTSDSAFIDNQIIEIEQDLKIPPFHWREHSWKIKVKFLRKIWDLENWTCLIIVVNNTRQSNQSTLELIAKALQGFDIHKMYIDGKKHKAYTNILKRSLKSLGIKVSTLRLVRHQARGGLRIADAVAGLARLNYDKKAKKEAVIYFGKFLKKKITTQILSGY